MEATKATTTNLFADWIGSIPVKDYDSTRKAIIRRCHITPQVFRHWKNGNSAVPELAKPIINEIAGYNVFTIQE